MTDIQTMPCLQLKKQKAEVDGVEWDMQSAKEEKAVNIIHDSIGWTTELDVRKILEREE